MIEDPDVIEARFVSDAPNGTQFVRGGVLSTVVHPKTHWVRHPLLTHHGAPHRHWICSTA